MPSNTARNDPYIPESVLLTHKIRVRPYSYESLSIPIRSHWITSDPVTHEMASAHVRKSNTKTTPMWQKYRRTAQCSR